MVTHITISQRTGTLPELPECEVLECRLVSYLLKEVKYTDDVTHLCRTFKKMLIYILDELVLNFEVIMGIL